MTDSVFVSAGVEGLVDEAVVRHLILEVGGRPHAVYGRNGKEHLRRQVQGYNHAARRQPWVVLVDLNAEAECAPPLVEDWVPDPAPHLCFRVAVREVEAWLLADAERMARFLSVPPARVPREPESLADPKRSLVDLARASRRRDIREDMVPRPASGRPIGPAYTSRLIEFARDPEAGWRPGVAAPPGRTAWTAV